MAFFVIKLFLALLAQTNFNECVFLRALFNISEVDLESIGGLFVAGDRPTGSFTLLS